MQIFWTLSACQNGSFSFLACSFFKESIHFNFPTLLFMYCSFFKESIHFNATNTPVHVLLIFQRNKNKYLCDREVCCFIEEFDQP